MLIVSDKFLDFPPDYYAEASERRVQMPAGQPALFRDSCQFASLVRSSPQPLRAAQAFHECLVKAHADAGQRKA